MPQYYFSSSIQAFLDTDPNEVVGRLALKSEFHQVEQAQLDAWLREIKILRETLPTFSGRIYFEYSIPRMGRRIDTLLLIGAVVLILEFKVGERHFLPDAIDQVMDYALDLKNFHETSHDKRIAPILIATDAPRSAYTLSVTAQQDDLLLPICCNGEQVGQAIRDVVDNVDETAPKIEPDAWEAGRYAPTPTIVEAAVALYRNHSVEEISRSDAGAINLSKTTRTISDVIQDARDHSRKAICFVTGVPGAGKTLVGLDIATRHFDNQNDLYSVFLSGNGPLVAILREALTRDKLQTERERGKQLRKGEVMSEVKAFIQNVHHFRDYYLEKAHEPPIEHVVLFDEAQRAWDLEQTASFMRRKKGIPNFLQSEPQFLISCLDRHADWAVVVCLVGGGQEINTGEAGIAEWLRALQRQFCGWQVYISPQMKNEEYGALDEILNFSAPENIHYKPDLHLSVSMRSFRAENVSQLVGEILNLDSLRARQTLAKLQDKYPILLTRSLPRAKKWLREQARGSERYGIIVSSQAERLKPHAIDVKSPIDPIHWFLDGKSDVRSSYYLEDVATEFHVQGLELDWACVTWDADFQYSDRGWQHRSFVGDRWNQIKKADRQVYQLNAYRVLLTRARQGMVVVVPEGDPGDPTRRPEFYDPTFAYLRGIGLPVI